MPLLKLTDIEDVRRSSLGLSYGAGGPQVMDSDGMNHKLQCRRSDNDKQIGKPRLKQSSPRIRRLWDRFTVWDMQCLRSKNVITTVFDFPQFGNRPASPRSSRIPKVGRKEGLHYARVLVYPRKPSWKNIDFLNVLS